MNDDSLASLETSYAAYAPTLEPQGKDRMLLVLKYASSPRYETRILIDTGRRVILSIENRELGKATGTTRFDDFVEAAGSWWARKVETLNADGKHQSLVTQTIKTLTLDELDKQTKTELHRPRASAVPPPADAERRERQERARRRHCEL